MARTRTTTSRIAIAAAALGCVVALNAGTAFASPSTAEFATLAGHLTTPREFAAGTALPNGDVLVAGGSNGSTLALSSAELFSPANGQFAPTGSMTTPRYCAAAAAMADGDVLVVGGQDESGTILASAELYNPITGTFTPTGAMMTPRTCPAAAPLPNGDVLVVGGTSDGLDYLSSAEIYDPYTGHFSATGSLSHGVQGPFAAALNDGDVLVGGGDTPVGKTSAVDLYDPTTGTFSPTGSLITARGWAAATTLADGRVLVAGGASQTGWLSSAELYDPTTKGFSATASLPSAEVGAVAGTLRDGRALVASGTPDNSTPTGTAELYSSAAQASPSIEQFPLTGIGMTVSETLVIKNTGVLPLVIANEVVAGDDAGDFAISSDGCAGADLFFDESCSMTISFAPSAAGTRTAILELSDNEVHPAWIILTGTAVPSRLAGPPPPSPTHTGTGTGTGTGHPQHTVKLVTCVRRSSRVRHAHCTTSLVAPPHSLTGRRVTATLTRRGHVYARGGLHHGELVVWSRSRVRGGRYSLAVKVAGRTYRETVRVA
jgi:hypothetical protein